VAWRAEEGRISNRQAVSFFLRERMPAPCLHDLKQTLTQRA
jgi:hypothetical protein